jgi:hypothetical protein
VQLIAQRPDPARLSLTCSFPWEIGAPFFTPLRPGGRLYRSLSLIRKRLTTSVGSIAVCGDYIWRTVIAQPGPDRTVPLQSNNFTHARARIAGFERDDRFAPIFLSIASNLLRDYSLQDLWAARRIMGLGPASAGSFHGESPDVGMHPRAGGSIRCSREFPGSTRRPMPSPALARIFSTIPRIRVTAPTPP